MSLGRVAWNVVGAAWALDVSSGLKVVWLLEFERVVRVNVALVSAAWRDDVARRCHRGQRRKWRGDAQLRRRGRDP